MGRRDVRRRRSTSLVARQRRGCRQENPPKHALKRALHVPSLLWKNATPGSGAARRLVRAQHLGATFRAGAQECFLQRVPAMGITSELTQEINQVLQDLVGARDDARVRAHLLGLEARQRLGDLEREIENFERKLSTRGEWVAEQVVATARGLTRAVADVIAPVREQTPARVRDAMTRAVVTCRPHDSLNRAAQLMWDADCGAVPIVDDEGRLIGILTDRDICMAAYTRGLPLSELAASSAMSTALHSCKPGDSLRSLMDAMAKYQVRRVPVIDEDGKLVGIVSLADVARLSQAPSAVSTETRIWVPGVLAGISEPGRAVDAAAS